MTETADHPTSPTLTTEPPPPPPVAREVPSREGPNRLYQLLAWVGIVAGVVFIVAIVFFSGFFLGRHSGAGHGHFGSHQGRGVHFFHRAEPGHMGTIGPQFRPNNPPNSVTPSSPTAVPTPRP